MSIEQQFHQERDKKLWTAGDPGAFPGLRSSLDAAEYKQIMLGRIFLG